MSDSISIGNVTGSHVAIGAGARTGKKSKKVVVTLPPESERPPCQKDNANPSEYLITYKNPDERVGRRLLFTCKNHLAWGIDEILKGKGIPREPFVIVYPLKIKAGG